MGIFQKIFTAIRGGAREVGETIVDANAIRIFEQEIEDAKNALNKAKGSLTEVMAKEMQTKRKIDSLKNNIGEHEGYAGEALNKGDEGLALEIAEKIGEFENELNEQVAILSTFQGSVTALKQQIKDAEKSIKENQRQLVMVKTTDSVQKATMAVNDNLVNNNSTMSSAKESLERIKKRQQDQQDKLAASKALSDQATGADLKARMSEAGIGDSAKAKSDDILARIRAKQSS